MNNKHVLILCLLGVLVVIGACFAIFQTADVDLNNVAMDLTNDYTSNSTTSNGTVNSEMNNDNISPSEAYNQGYNDGRYGDVIAPNPNWNEKYVQEYNDGVNQGIADKQPTDRTVADDCD